MRREAWRSSLPPTDPALPIRGVTWPEAFAYAAWAGKRLPSFVEWEFAVRGGARYRPFASSREGRVRGADDRAIRFGLGAEGTPWPRGQGADVAVDSGIRDLCGNVAEWTGTPASWGGTAGLDPARFAEEHRASMVAPQEVPGSAHQAAYWVAGGSYASSEIDFFVADHHDPRESAPTIGFRCAVAARTVLAQLGEERDRVRFERRTGE